MRVCFILISVSRWVDQSPETLNNLLEVPQPLMVGPEVEGSRGPKLCEPWIEHHLSPRALSLINWKSSLSICFNTFINGASALVFFKARDLWWKKNLKTPSLQNKFDLHSLLPSCHCISLRASAWKALSSLLQQTKMLLRHFPNLETEWVVLFCLLLLQKAQPSALAAPMLFLSSGWRVCLHHWAEPPGKSDQARLLSELLRLARDLAWTSGLSQRLMSERMPSAERVLRTSGPRAEAQEQTSAYSANPMHARWRWSDVLITGLERN